MKRFTVLSLIYLSFTILGVSQDAKVISGPMPGYTTMREVGVWLQLDHEADVYLEYNETGKGEKHKTDVVHTEKEMAHIAKFEIPDLEPGVIYDYIVFVNGNAQSFPEKLQFHTQALWQYRSDPPAFKIALGSCTYINEEKYDRPGTPYGGGYQIFNAIADKKPDFMLWMGDNIYLREVDWSARSGYLYRYTHTRSIPEMQRLLRTTHHYAIWDDHDFGPNDANGSWIHKNWALETFDLFWMNPSCGIPELRGTTTAFRYNDMDFFLLDNRFHRSADNLVNDKPQYLGKRQIEWLIDAMKYSNAPFKFVVVGGQVLNPSAVFETMSVYGAERKMLMRRIIEEKIEGVVFLTGDRHHTELSRFEAENGIVIYDLTVSPLTSSPHIPESNEANTMRVDGTLVTERNFGTLEFSGPRTDRKMKITVFDSNGKELWNKELIPGK